MKAKKLATVLFLLLAVETWGVVGAARTRGVRYSCTLQVGPLCYLWEESTIGKLLGEDRLDEVEDALEAAKKAWEGDLVEKLQNKKGRLGKALDDAADMAKDGLESAKRAIEDSVK